MGSLAHDAHLENTSGKPCGSHRLCRLSRFLSHRSLVQKYEILYVFPFSSETKRMGIILKEEATGTIFFYMKVCVRDQGEETSRMWCGPTFPFPISRTLQGADVVMSKIVKESEWLDEECGNMAREGSESPARVCALWAHVLRSTNSRIRHERAYWRRIPFV